MTAPAAPATSPGLGIRGEDEARVAVGAGATGVAATTVRAIRMAKATRRARICTATSAGGKGEASMAVFSIPITEKCDRSRQLMQEQNAKNASEIKKFFVFFAFS
jgi:hypothetical protein